MLAQALDTTGQINPSWVLSGITGIAAFLIWNQIKEIKGSLKEMAKSMMELNDLVHLHDKDIAVMKSKLSDRQ